MVVKVFDKVYAGDNKVPAIIVEDLGDDFMLVDTIISGCYRMSVKDLEPMPDPKGLLIMKSDIPVEQIKEFKKWWDQQTLEFEKQGSYRVPIFKE